MAYTPNPVGYVAPFDGGNPRIITAIASETISGGEPVQFSGAAGAIGSRMDSYTSNEIFAARASAGAAAGSKFNGIAIDTVTSGNYIGVATAGTVIMYADGNVTNGHPVMLGSNACVRDVGSDAPTIQILSKIGRAITNAGSEQFAIIQLTP